VDYRITGFWRWKTVVVPPNVYVVHTRRGHVEPLHVGLGTSFPYNPSSDAFLLIPAVVQTLLIAARCICQERQGILVQAYVQWRVDDVRTAYRRLDFSDPDDPMRLVNVQLREQAEAAIKDKVATMSIEDVLSDKQPIIEELTHRLRGVAEGGRDGDGLGLKIVTVQIKEAVVSSARLWENLQRPFRAEREKLARLAELDSEQHISRQELANRQEREAEELATERHLAALRAERDREEYDRTQAEEARRLRAELDAVGRQAELDRAGAERDRLRHTTRAELDDIVHKAEAGRAERDLALFRQRRAVENELTSEHVQSQLIARLPEIAAALPKPEELRAVTIGPDAGAGSSLVGFLASVLELARRKPSTNGA
jgi:regulator of protease activity HflC (stomatin/prohibitin superfamily)